MFSDCRLPLAIWDGSSAATASLRRGSAYDHDWIPDYGGIAFDTHSTGTINAKSYGSTFNALSMASPVALFSICKPLSTSSVGSSCSLLGYSKPCELFIRKIDCQHIEVCKFKENTMPSKKHPFFVEIDTRSTVELSHTIDAIHVSGERAVIRCEDQFTLFKLNSDVSRVLSSELKLPSINASGMKRHPHLLSLNPSPYLPEIICDESITGNLDLYNYEREQVIWSYNCQAKVNSQGEEEKNESNSLYICENHPRIAILGKVNCVEQYDCREAPTIQPRILMNVGSENVNTSDFETIYSVSSVDTVPYQHIILTTFHILLMDERMPRRTMLQWKHSLDNTYHNRLHSISSHSLTHSSKVISACNDDTVCLVSLDYESVSDDDTFSFSHATSRHSPWHAMCLSHYTERCEKKMLLKRTRAEEADGHSVHREEKLCGLVSLVSPRYGLTLIAASTSGRLFMQDFLVNSASLQMQEKKSVKKGNVIKEEQDKEEEKDDQGEEEEKAVASQLHQTIDTNAQCTQRSQEYEEYSFRLEKHKIDQEKYHVDESHRTDSGSGSGGCSSGQKCLQNQFHENANEKSQLKCKSKTHCSCFLCSGWRVPSSIEQKGIDRKLEEKSVTAFTSQGNSRTPYQVIPVNSEHLEHTAHKQVQHEQSPYYCVSHLFDLSDNLINNRQEAVRECNDLTQKLFNPWMQTLPSANWQGKK